MVVEVYDEKCRSAGRSVSTRTRQILNALPPLVQGGALQKIYLGGGRFDARRGGYTFCSKVLSLNPKPRYAGFGVSLEKANPKPSRAPHTPAAPKTYTLNPYFRKLHVNSVQISNLSV